MARVQAAWLPALEALRRTLPAMSRLAPSPRAYGSDSAARKIAPAVWSPPVYATP